MTTLPLNPILPNKKRRRRLAFRLTVTLLPCVLVVFMGVISYNHWREYRRLRSFTRVTTGFALQAITQELRAHTTRVEQSVELMAALASAARRVEEKNTKLWLETALRGTPGALTAIIAYPPGVHPRREGGYAPYVWLENQHTRHRDLATDSAAYTDAVWFQLPRLLQRAIWCEPQTSRLNENRRITTCAAPIFATRETGRNKTAPAEPEVIGVAAMDVEIAQILDWMPKDIPFSEHIMLISGQGAILSPPAPHWPLDGNLFTIAEEMEMPAMRQMALALTRGESGMLSLPDPYTGITTFYVYEPIPEMGWSLVVALPEKSLFMRVFTRGRDLFLIFLVGMVGLFVVTLLLTRTMVRPMRRLANLIQLMAIGKIGSARRQSGDLERELAHGGVRIYEYATLSSAATSMIETLHRLLNRVQAAGIAVTTTTRRIAATSRQLESATATQAQGVRTLNTNAKEITARTHALTDTMHAISRTAESHIDLFAKGQDRLRNVARDIGELSRKTDSLVTRLNAIHEKTVRIVDVVSTIQEVSERVNLLALNAGIEAEKAGETGRGFSVVAREIRRLAIRTASAAEDITQTVSEMTEAVQNGETEMEHFRAVMGNRAAEVREVELRIGGRIDGIRETITRFVTLRDSMRLQNEEAMHINDIVGKLNVETNTMQDILRDFSRELSQLNEAATILEEEVSRFDLTLPPAT